MKIHLSHSYPGINRAGAVSLGGNQQWLQSTVLQRCGCGVIATLDLVRYLHLWREGCRTNFFAGVDDATALPLPVYDLCVQRMRKSYIPVLYPIGTTGFALASGLNRYFRRYGLPLHARWGVPQSALWARIEAQLAADLPVILSIGNRFPVFWEKSGAALHKKRRDDTLYEATRTKAHFVTVLGIDDEWLRITSWGREYYLSRKEFRRYCDQVSMSILCNIVWLTEEK